MLEPLILISTVLFFTWLYNYLNKPKPYNPDRDLINVLDFATRNMKSHSTHFNQGDQFMSPKNKRAYLKSTKWKRTRLIILTRDDFTCQCCGTTERLEIHHNSYEHLGDEYPHQLDTVCRDCHQQIHDKLGYDRTTFYPITILK